VHSQLTAVAEGHGGACIPWWRLRQCKIAKVCLHLLQECGVAQEESPGMLPTWGGTQHGNDEDEDGASHLQDEHDSRVDPGELGIGSGEVHDMELS
jgi:hypothetical protein